MQLISRSLSRVIHNFGVESSDAGPISPVLFVADTPEVDCWRDFEPINHMPFQKSLKS
jgi:hypothetical protein